jgi:Tfp pilus assembly protein PilO
MSASKDYINKKWVDWIVTLLITLVTIGAAFGLDITGGLATREYVNTEINTVKAQAVADKTEQNVKIESIRNEQTMQYSTILKLLESIDNRTKRLEDHR